MPATIINADTKLATIFKSNPDALEAIISISPKFKKLRNPMLRRVMAARTTIAMASKVGDCNPNEFFKKLQPLGFVIDKSSAGEKIESKVRPDFMNLIDNGQVEELDVRPIIESGKDPFRIITERIKKVNKGDIFKLINSFEPIPLIQILSKEGYKYHVETINENEVNTYFYKEDEREFKQPDLKTGDDWESIMSRYKDNLIKIDVRQLEMPQPMLTILHELDNLPGEKALFVHHKRIPVFLLPELKERQFDYRIKEVSEGEVYLIIFKA